MREYKFRGKALMEEDESIELTDRIVKHGDWVYGNLIFTSNGIPYIVGKLVEVEVDYTVLHYWIPVDCVGQFTGLHDKNGVEIYEGDIVLSDFFTWEGKCIVKFGEYHNEEQWDNERMGYGYYTEMLNGEPSSRRELNNDVFVLEVIGNIHNNEVVE